jgi:hypothetical protein
LHSPPGISFDRPTGIELAGKMREDLQYKQQEIDPNNKKRTGRAVKPNLDPVPLLAGRASIHTSAEETGVPAKKSEVDRFGFSRYR